MFVLHFVGRKPGWEWEALAGQASEVIFRKVKFLGRLWRTVFHRQNFTYTYVLDSWNIVSIQKCVLNECMSSLHRLGVGG